MADVPQTLLAPTAHDPKDVEENKDLAALSYAWIMSVVLLIAKRKSPFVHFHAKQGTVLFVLSLLFLMIPYANRVLELFVFAFMVWGFLAAAQGHWTELPFVGPLSRGKFKLRGSWKQTVGAMVNCKNWIRDLWSKPGTSEPPVEDPATPRQGSGQASNPQPPEAPLPPTL